MSTPPGRRPRRESVTSAVLMFAVSGLLSLALVTAGALYFARRTATQEAERDSLGVTEAAARNLIEPILSDALAAGDPGAIARLDDTVRSRVLGNAIVRVKLWSRDGVIVYSDEPRLIGQRYDLDEDDLKSFGNQEPEADISDLSRPENIYEKPYGKLLEVYFPLYTREGTPILFEAYLPYASVSERASEIWRSFLPTVFAGLITLEVLQLPLAWSLARRLRARQVEREQLLHRAVEASNRERRLIAGELHDGVVQDLVGQSYRLLAVADGLAGVAPGDSVAAIRQEAIETRTAIKSLRTLLVDLYPPNLRSEGLEPALADLAARLRSAGVLVNIAMLTDVRLSEEWERLLYRAAREALRNIERHSGARNVNICIEHQDGYVSLTIIDDGIGIAGENQVGQRQEGHLGLDLLGSLLRDAGGHLSVRAGETGGTRFEVRLPL